MTAQPARPLIAGNWKMHGSRASVTEIDMLKAALDGGSAADVVVCPPATLLLGFAALLKGTAIAVGGQDCRAEPSGAYTGDISAQMLRDAGASFVILGHSERRTYHGERDSDVRAKAEAAIRAGLVPIVCVGETAGERRLGMAEQVVGRQLANALPAAETDIVVAYEPVWAIGTGLVPTDADVAAMHGFIRRTLGDRFGARGATLRILYGGSVKPANAAGLLRIEAVDGALIGGASLRAEDFLAIIAAA